MNVTSLSFTDPTNTTVKTTYEDGTESYGPFPANDRPTKEAHDAFIANGGTATLFAPKSPTVADIVNERTRRLASGFYYTFPDERGTHLIGTSAADLIGWREVSEMAQAAINTGQPNAPIAVVTNTGPVTVTATEWQAVLLAAAAFRQPLWAKSFALQAMNPIPADYTADKYWQ